jgi:hypothetical protein
MNYVRLGTGPKSLAVYRSAELEIKNKFNSGNTGIPYIQRYQMKSTYTPTPVDHDEYDTEVELNRPKINYSGNPIGVEENYTPIGPTGPTCNLQGVCTTSITGETLDPLFDPKFNVVEAIKNMILLEDHLFHPKRRCQDCIRKHCLSILGFLEEAISLDTQKQHTQVLESTQSEFNKVYQRISAGLRDNNLTAEQMINYAQDIRQIRKPLMGKYA